MNLEDIWNKSLLRLEEKVGSSIAELWFKPIKLLQLKEHQATIDIPNRFFRDWIEENYPDLIAESLGNTLGLPIEISYKTEEKLDPVVKKMDMKLENRRQSLAKRGICDTRQDIQPPLYLWRRRVRQNASHSCSRKYCH